MSACAVLLGYSWREEYAIFPGYFKGKSMQYFRDTTGGYAVIPGYFREWGMSYFLDTSGNGYAVLPGYFLELCNFS